MVNGISSPSEPSEFATGDKLTSDMVGIGMRFASSPPSSEPNIEDTLVAASIEGIVHEDYRVLSLLVDWFGMAEPGSNDVFDDSRRIVEILFTFILSR